MKKLLLCTLTLCAFIGITGCSSEKKLSAEEAKTTIKAAAENTQKKLNTTASIKAKEAFKGSVGAESVKLLAGTTALAEVEKAKVNLNVSANETFTYDKTNKKAKITADANAKVDANITAPILKNLLGWDSPKKMTYTAKANGEAYYVDGEEQANIYAKYNAELNDQLAKDFNISTTTYNGKYNFKTVMLMNLLDKLDFEDDDADTSTTTDDEFIKDWTIFKKKGNVIIADCSNLEAFDLGEDFKKTQNELKEKGIEFKVSKFQFELNKDQTIKSVDFDLAVDGKVDLSKAGFTNEDYLELVGMISKVKPDAATIASKLPVDGLSGTLSIDFDLSLGLEFNYSPEAITVSDDLKAVEEKDLDEMIMTLMFGSMKTTTPDDSED